MSDENPNGFNTAIATALRSIDEGDTSILCRTHLFETVDLVGDLEIIKCCRCGLERVE